LNIFRSIIRINAALGIILLAFMMTPFVGGFLQLDG
jgi:hypothetical protein